MTFEELLNIRICTCDARGILNDLREADIITSKDYVDSCERFHKTHCIVRDYMREHGIH